MVSPPVGNSKSMQTMVPSALLNSADKKNTLKFRKYHWEQSAKYEIFF